MRSEGLKMNELTINKYRYKIESKVLRKSAFHIAKPLIKNNTMILFFRIMMAMLVNLAVSGQDSKEANLN